MRKEREGREGKGGRWREGGITNEERWKKVIFCTI